MNVGFGLRLSFKSTVSARDKSSTNFRLISLLVMIGGGVLEGVEFESANEDVDVERDDEPVVVEDRDGKGLIFGLSSGMASSATATSARMTPSSSPCASDPGSE